MSIKIKIRAREFNTEPMPLKVVLGPELLYGAYDEGWRLQSGERGDGELVAYMPMQLGRGISVSWSEEETECISLRILIPTGPLELRAFFEMVYRIADYWDGTLEVDGKPMDLEDFLDDYNNIQMFNEDALNQMVKSILNGENKELTLFSVMWPLVMGKNEADAFNLEPSYFPKWLHDKQNVDAYYSKPAFYRSEEGVLGRYAISEDMRCIIPIKPYVPYGFDDPETSELIECEDFGILLYSMRQNETIGEVEYGDFVRKLRSKMSKKIKRYDGNHLLVEKLTEDELESLIK